MDFGTRTCEGQPPPAVRPSKPRQYLHDSDRWRSADREGHDFSSCRVSQVAFGWRSASALRFLTRNRAASAAEVTANRMLAVLQFSEDDDMAFTLDRMFTRINPMRARLSSGNCFLRFVVIADQAQRRSICSALNQWMLSSAEKASGIPAGFSSSLELSPQQKRLALAHLVWGGHSCPPMPNRAKSSAGLRKGRM